MALSDKVEFTPAARRDIRNILAYTRREHGKQMERDYGELLRASFKQLEKDPFTLGSKDRGHIAKNIRSYHLELSKRRINSPIRKPRHVVFYFTVDKTNRLVISRVLHDAQDVTRNMAEMRDHVIEHTVDSGEQGRKPRESDSAKKRGDRER
jgi:plasmid stabilization system protein ParE